MDHGIEEIIRDRLNRLTGKPFQQIVWDILMCLYPDFIPVKMQHDLGNDGYSVKEGTFYAMYAPETIKYDISETSKKITNNDPKKLGDYEKFVKNWKPKFNFIKWIFVTRDNLTGKPNLKIAELNSINDGVTKEYWGLDRITQLAFKLKPDDLNRIFQTNTNDQNLGSEVETIIDLISYISQFSELENSDFENLFPDPDKKIYQRFAKYCVEIENEIKNYAFYSKAYKEAQEVIGQDSIRIAKTRGYLKRISRKMLRENNGNPINALESLTKHFENILINQNKKKYDYNAIRYYLIGEIPKCNVFPNE